MNIADPVLIGSIAVAVALLWGSDHIQPPRLGNLPAKSEPTKE
jgi:hypothetical protein